MNNDELLFTNKYVADMTQHAGYGMTDQLRRHQLKQHVESQYITLSKDVEADAELLEEDLLKTNPVLTEDGEAKTMGENRRVSEIRSTININSFQRDYYDNSFVLPRNPNTGLYTREVSDETGVHVQLYNPDILNNENVPGVTDGVPDIQRPYFTRPDGDIGKKTYKYPNPNDYTISLPRTYTNVKSVRLLSVEVPNTINSINQYNNLIMLDIRDVDTNASIPLKTGKSPYSFIMFQLTPGNYNLSQLADHIQERVNEIVLDYSVDGFSDLFTINVNERSGLVTISLDDPPGRDLEFHWRFWFVDETNSALPITRNTNLWFMLGFPHPYEINQNGTDKYTKILSNQFDFGMNPLINGDVPDRPEFHVISAVRFPDVFPNKYIYLEIGGMGSIIDLQNPQVTRFNSNDLFAKVILDVPPGQTTTNFVSTPKVFSDVLPSLQRLKIKWVDSAGLPVNFQLQNHSFALEIVEYIDELNVNSYNSRRGTIDTSSYPDIIKYGGH